MDEGLVFEALRRGLITPEQAKSKVLEIRGTSSQPSKPTESAITRFAKGAVEGVGQAGLGVMQAATDLVSPKPMFGMEPVNPTLANVVAPVRKTLTATVDASRNRANQGGTAGRLGNVAGLVGGSLPFVLAGKGEVGPTTGLGRIAGAATLGAEQGAVQPLGSEDSRLKNAAIGGVTSGAFQGVLEGGKQVGRAVLPQIDKTTATLADRAEELGIPVSINQLSPTRGRNTLQKVSQAIPFSGVQGFQDTQRAAWHRAVARTIGEEADDLGPETVQKFLDRSSQGFKEALDGTTVELTPAGVTRLDNLATNAKEFLTGDVANIVEGQINRVKADFAGDVIDGSKLASFRSSLIEKIPQADSRARGFLMQLVDVVDDIAQHSPENAKKLKVLRREWRNYKTLEPLLEKSTDGTINPVLLQQRVASNKHIKSARIGTGDDELVDLARIGKKFLVIPGGSDTFDKSIMAGAVGGSVSDPTGLAATAAGTTIGGNRAYQKLYNQAQWIKRKVVKRALEAPNPKSRPVRISVSPRRKP